jgi:hypothetical protein
MEKRGISHIEMILSFILFAAAVGFALYFLSPTNVGKIKDVSLDYTARSIEKNTTIEVLVYSVVIDNNTIIDAGSPQIIALNFSGVNPGYNSRVENYNGTLIDSSRSGEMVYIRGGSLGWDKIDFVYVKFGEDFATQSVSSATHDKTYYSVSTKETKSVISEKRFSNLKSLYDSGYESLKVGFNLPKRTNFGFQLAMAGNNIKAETRVSSSQEVFARTKRIEVLREDGRIEFGDLKVMIW